MSKKLYCTVNFLIEGTHLSNQRSRLNIHALLTRIARTQDEVLLISNILPRFSRIAAIYLHVSALAFARQSRTSA